MKTINEVIIIDKKDGEEAKETIRWWFNCQSFGSFTKDFKGRKVIVDWIRFDANNKSETIIDTVEDKVTNYRVTLKPGYHYKAVEDYSENEDVMMDDYDD